MAQLPVIELDKTVTPHNAKLRAAVERLDTQIGANVRLIAAHALALDATPVSGDAGFSRVPSLRVENWFSVEI